MWTDSRLIYSEFTIARDICEAGIPDYGRIWIVYVLCVAIHSNGPNSLPVFALRGFLTPGVRNAERRRVGTAGWLCKAQLMYSRSSIELKLKLTLLKGSLLHV